LCSIIDLKSGRQIVRFSPDKASTNRTDMRESPDGSYLLVAGLKGMLMVFDYRQLLAGKTPPPLASMESRRTSVAALSFSADGATLAITHAHSNAVQFFDLKNRAMARQITGNVPYSRLRFSSDGARLTGAGREEITVWRYPSLEPVATLKRRYTPQLLFSADGNRALAMDNQMRASARHKDKRGRGDWMSEVTEYDLVTAREVRSTVLENLGTGSNMYHLLCVDFDKQIAAFKLYSAFVYSLKDGSLQREVKMPKAPESEWLSIWEGKWRFDCDRLDFVPASPELTNTPGDWQRDHAESANGRIRARIDSLEDATVTIYDKSGKERNNFKTIATPWDRGNYSSAVALAPDGSLLAVGTELGDIAIYDTTQGKQLGRYIYFSDGEWAWISADGAVNGSKTGMARLEMLKE
jgi:WD40 repeat protein